MQKEATTYKFQLRWLKTTEPREYEPSWTLIWHWCKLEWKLQASVKNKSTCTDLQFSLEILSLCRKISKNTVLHITDKKTYQSHMYCVCSYVEADTYFLFVCWLLPSKHAGVSQGCIFSDYCMCCHTEIEVADQTFYLTQSQYTNTKLTSPSTDPTTPGVWLGSYCWHLTLPLNCVNLYIVDSFVARVAQSAVCWARCPVWCSITCLNLFWAFIRWGFSLGHNIVSDSILSKLFRMRV